jgi:type IV pilus assembly protein PilA
MFKKINRKNKKGFTLAELLIVVAIIGVLVAVSIPIFTAQLEKSREATDLANLRAAKAAAVSAYLTEDATVFDTDASTGAKTIKTSDIYYNAGQGKLSDTGDAIGKGTATKGGCASTTFGTYTYTEDSDVAGQKIKVTIGTNGDVTCKFVK